MLSNACPICEHGACHSAVHQTRRGARPGKRPRPGLASGGGSSSTTDRGERPPGRRERALGFCGRILGGQISNQQIRPDCRIRWPPDMGRSSLARPLYPIHLRLKHIYIYICLPQLQKIALRFVGVYIQFQYSIGASDGALYRSQLGGCRPPPTLRRGSGGWPDKAGFWGSLKPWRGETRLKENMLGLRESLVAPSR